VAKAAPAAGTAPAENARHSSLQLADVRALFARPLLELVFEAARVHRQHQPEGTIQCSQLANIKAGGCPEDCKYCSQSARYDTPVDRQPLSSVESVLEQAHKAKANGADRFCMGAAWRQVRDGKEFEQVLSMVRGVKSLGLESCATLGMLEPHQAAALKAAGLDYYNHNLDTGPSHYGQVISTRTYADRLRTLEHVRAAGLSVCCGGILGLGEGEADRAELLFELARMQPPPESVPINSLVPIEGTPLGDTPRVGWDELVRTVAVARILMPKSAVRLSAGRTALSEEAQALCFLAGVNSIFVGDELLTTPNPNPASDGALLAKLGLRARTEQRAAPESCASAACSTAAPSQGCGGQNAPSESPAAGGLAQGTCGSGHAHGHGHARLAGIPVADASTAGQPAQGGCGQG
jgi:biotin synthase